MYKIINTHTTKYSEEPQNNPLRWQLMLRDKDTLTSQSSILMCKDFFNDVVAWKKAELAFSIYHFDNKVQFNEEGMYLVLTNVANCGVFRHNLEVVNDQLADQGFPVVDMSKQDPKSMVIMIPNELWESTYTISVLSMMIRLSNYKITYKCWEDFFHSDAPINTSEHSFDEQTKKFVQESGFLVPEKYKGYWYYSIGGFHSEKKGTLSPSIIHNNGARNWVTAMSKEEA